MRKSRIKKTECVVDEGEKEADIPLSYGREEEGGSDRGGGEGCKA